MKHSAHETTNRIYKFKRTSILIKKIAIFCTDNLEFSNGGMRPAEHFFELAFFGPNYHHPPNRQSLEFKGLEECQ